MNIWKRIRRVATKSSTENYGIEFVALPEYLEGASPMLDYGAAVKMAEEYLLENSSGCDVELVLIPDKTDAFELGWIFYYQSKKYLKSENVLDMVAGNAPIIINKFDGTIAETGTALPIKKYLADYRLAIKDNVQTSATAVVDKGAFLEFLTHNFDQAQIEIDRFSPHLWFITLDCFSEQSYKLAIEIGALTIKIDKVEREPVVDFSLYGYVFKDNRTAELFVENVYRYQYFPER